MAESSKASMAVVHAIEEYLRSGRYFEHETLEVLMMEWFEATARMRNRQLGPDLKRSIVGVIGKLGLRGREVPSQAMDEMQNAAFEALAGMDIATRERLLRNMVDTFSSLGAAPKKTH